MDWAASARFFAGRRLPHSKPKPLAKGSGLWHSGPYPTDGRCKEHAMFKPKDAFSSFSVDDLEKARQFYGGTL
jgi:hypothetical protein